MAARHSETPQESLSEVLLIDSSGWFAPRQTSDLEALLNAARDRRRVRLRYRRSADTTSRWLITDPYGLVSKAASWYLVADVDGQPRLFNTSRIQAHQPLQEAAVLRPGQNLRTVWETLLRGFEPPQLVQVQALLRSTRVALARRILGARLASVTDTDSEWSTIIVEYPDIESVRQLLQFGDHIRVLNPTEAVQRIHDLAAQLTHHHQMGTSTNTPGQDS